MKPPRAKTWRILFWIALAAILLEVLGLGATFGELRRRRAADAMTLAPDQIASVVHLWPRLDAGLRDDVLRALSWSGLTYRITRDPPVAAPEDKHVHEVETALRRRLSSEEAQSVTALIRAKPRVGERRAPSWALSSEPLRVYVQIADGAWLNAEVRGELGPRFFGLPTGFWTGVIGLLLAAGVLIVILREGRAVERIARSVEAFANTGVPQPLPVGGSPELAGLATRTAAMQQQVATLLRERTTMLGAVAHDIKTYVQRLKLRLDLLDEPEQIEKARRDLDAMNKFVEDTLLLAVHENPPQHAEPVDLLKLLAHEVEAARLAGGDATLTHEGARFVVLGDGAALARAFANVIGNAIRYGKQARVTLRREGESIEALVDDRGPGVPLAEREAVFAAFHRGEQSRSRSTGGTGLGLAITQRIVQRVGGTVRIDDAPSGGARVAVRLPASETPGSRL